jgi:hypothetical protein
LGQSLSRNNSQGSNSVSITDSLKAKKNLSTHDSRNINKTLANKKASQNVSPDLQKMQYNSKIKLNGQSAT